MVLLGPGLLHLAQRAGKAARVHVGGGIQAPQEVLPRRDAGVQHSMWAHAGLAYQPSPTYGSLASSATRPSFRSLT